MCEWPLLPIFFSDSLVFDLQFIHDGHFPSWLGFNDFDEDPAQGLCSLFQRRWFGWYGKRFGRWIWMETGMLWYPCWCIVNECIWPFICFYEKLEPCIWHLFLFFQVHGDVFRPASNSLIFSALVGTGYQIAAVVFIVICFAIIGDLYTE